MHHKKLTVVRILPDWPAEEILFSRLYCSETGSAVGVEPDRQALGRCVTRKGASTLGSAATMLCDVEEDSSRVKSAAKKMGDA